MFMQIFTIRHPQLELQIMFLFIVVYGNISMICFEQNINITVYKDSKLK